MTAGRDQLVSLDGVFLRTIREIGFMPPALAAFIAELNLDLANHHRRSVLSHHGFVSGDRARRFIASRMYGYGGRKRSDRVTKIEDAQGESFFAARDSVRPGAFPLDEKSIVRLEEGGTVSTSERMAIPIGRGKPYKGVFQNTPIWRRTKRGLDSRDFDIVPDPSNRSRAFIVDARESSIRRAAREGRPGDDLIVGVLVRSRKQGPKLRFFAEYERILPGHLRKYEKAIDEATTVAGRKALQERVSSLTEDRSAYAQAFRESLSSEPGNFRKAREVAKAAQRAARRERVSR